GLGIGLNACAASISGSVMTAVALFFAAAAWVSPGRKAANVALLVSVAIVFKMFDVVLLGLPLGSTAVVHPAFAFVLEGAAFLAAGALFARFLKPSPGRRIFWGGASALAAVAAFPLVRLVSGVPACVVPGSTVPLAWAYAPLAVGLSMLTVPLGLKMAEKSIGFATMRSWRVPAAVILCLALMIVARAI
ncbi:MAG: hypothetical protein ACYDH3_13280, partial [Candidatus Aminicenantales bacterium]